MQIRKALSEDAAAICDVLRRSIIELCVADHQNDPVILERWLRNKAPNQMKSWINDLDSFMLVAEEGPALLAVGAVSRAGEITLNYVLPTARFKGISRAMIKELEQIAQKNGAKTVTLYSTSTARQFYLSCGYCESPPEPGFFGPSVHPMHRAVCRR
jgi:GNAT superfamily N-acetyltransferase